ncbi:MAG: YbjN domain-containing protein [Microthrixaceae bacterium]
MSSGPDSSYPPATAEQLVQIEHDLERWLDLQLSENECVASIERDPSRTERRWVVRIEGEEKSFSAVWFHLGQRTLHVETYFMPAPEENHARLYEYLLRRGQKMSGFSFVIGLEDAVYLAGQIPVGWITDDELDRMLGSVYMYVEHSFRPAMRIGYESRFKG